MTTTTIRQERPHSEYFVELENVTLTYGQGDRQINALGLTNLRLKQGDFVALVGRQVERGEISMPLRGRDDAALVLAPKRLDLRGGRRGGRIDGLGERRCLDSAKRGAGNRQPRRTEKPAARGASGRSTRITHRAASIKLFTSSST